MLFFASNISCFIQNLFYHRLGVNKIIKISPEPLQILNSEGELIDISVPKSYFETKEIKCRILSASRRSGIIGEESDSSYLKPMSKNLILHCHGGVSYWDILHLCRYHNFFFYYLGFLYTYIGFTWAKFVSLEMFDFQHVSFFFRWDLSSIMGSSFGRSNFIDRI